MTYNFVYWDRKESDRQCEILRREMMRGGSVAESVKDAIVETLTECDTNDSYLVY